jgi:hypothetical protein
MSNQPSDWCLRWICAIPSRNVRMGSCNQYSPPHISSMQRPGIGACMDSYRAEAYGLLSITSFLHLLGNYYNHQVPPTEIWCDNMAVVNTVYRKIVRTPPEFPNKTLQPSWDLIQAICATIKLHPDVSLFHVKGNQDMLTDVRELPFPSQLNVHC